MASKNVGREGRGCAAAVGERHSAVDDAENIESRPLHDISLAVDKQHAVGTGVQGSEKAHGQIVPLVILGRRVHRPG